MIDFASNTKVNPDEEIVKATFAIFLNTATDQINLAKPTNKSVSNDNDIATSSTNLTTAPTQTQSTDTTSDSGKTYSVENNNTNNGFTAGTITIRDLPSTNGKPNETKQEVTFDGFKKTENGNVIDADLDAALIYLEIQAKKLKRGETLGVLNLSSDDLKKLRKAIEEDKNKGKTKKYETLSKLFDSKQTNNYVTIKFHNPTFWELIKAFFAKIGKYIKDNPGKTAGIILLTALAIGLILTGVGAIPVGLALGTVLIPAVKMTVGGLFISGGINCAFAALAIIAKPLITRWRYRKDLEVTDESANTSKNLHSVVAP